MEKVAEKTQRQVVKKKAAPKKKAARKKAVPVMLETSLREIHKIDKYALGEIDTAEINMLEENARFMVKEQFDTLVTNIEQDGELSSVPFCYVDPKTNKVTVLSGNHRIKASKVNGIEKTVIMYNVESMSGDEQTKLQLSHNAIAGQDDVQILRKLYEGIKDLEQRVGTGLDDEYFEKLANSAASLIESIEIPTISATLFFTDEMMDKFQEIIDGASSDEYIHAGDKAMFNKYLQMSQVIKDRYNILNAGYIFEALFDIYELYKKNGDNGFDGEMAIDGYKNLTIGGSKSLIKEGSATKLRKYISKCEDVDDFVNAIGTLFED